MELLDDPEIKKKYEKCKYIVKVWEHQFFKKHKRVPSKLDIREASREVRNAYKRYFQLKTAALEQSFMDVEGFEDEDENIDTNCSSSRLNECENVLASTENKDHVQVIILHLTTLKNDTSNM
ncbi:hypothetical protein JTB14_035597 [Gonioctena quinquepunctata]|nr:hypothetical protein JTB14_035597 [Gonioctena quinquepunctata]